MSEDLLITAAQRAASDGALLASLIGQLGESGGLTWSQIAARLQISEAQLARLALCRRPRVERFQEDIGQIAEYVGIDRWVLAQFVGRVENPQVVDAGIRTERRESRPVRRGNSEGNKTGGRGSRNTMMKRLVWVAGAVAVLVVLVGLFSLARPAQAEATLVVTAGQATVVQAGGGLLPVRAEVGTVVAAGEAIAVSQGDAIAVGAGGAAQLRLLDGSTVDLYPDTRVEMAELVTTAETYRVWLDMGSGKTLSRVRRVLGVGDEFQISTPSSSASVRGTVFVVEVIDPQTSYYACEEGTVLVRMGGREVEVKAGEDLLAIPGEMLSAKPQEEDTAGESAEVAYVTGEPVGDKAAPTGAGGESAAGEPAAGEPAVSGAGTAASASGGGEAGAAGSTATGTSGSPSGGAPAASSGDTGAGAAPPSGNTTEPPTDTAAPPTDTTTPTSTDVPPTDTPEPPTDTPVLPFSCSDITISHNNQARWRIRNNSSQPITLTNIAFSWPASRGTLVQITLEGHTIWSGSASPPSVNLTLSGSNREISAGQQRMLNFVFSGGDDDDDDDGGRSFNLTVTFDVGCPLSSTVDLGDDD